MKKYKVGFIGTGGRSVAYAKHYATSPEVEIVAMADPNASHRKAMHRMSELPYQPAEYNDFRDMLKEMGENLDGIVIASPNYLHAEHAVPCFELGLPVALEKPLATTMGDCEAILDAERINNGRSILGFVLRSSPFYTQIFELISSGAIGAICSIQADELPGLGVSSIMNRGFWRRNSANSGGAMLEKSSHDMDLFNWITESRPISLNSYGGNRIFNPNPLLPDDCSECSQKDTCQYYCKPVFSEHENEGEEIMHQFIRHDSACIYNVKKDIVDTQSVAIEYENGALINFMLTFNAMGEQSGRNFHAVGTRGRIWGNLHKAEVYHYDNMSDQLETYDCSGDGTGHGGGDKLHAMELLEMMKNPKYKPEQNASAGYLASAMCFAADLSMREHKRINFRYDQHGFISFK
jgi:predicted dehydrogenase